MANLRTLLRRAAGEYDPRRRAAEKAVTHWEYYSNGFYDPRPYYFERYGQPRGRRLANATPKGFSYGFGSSGRCTIARQPRTADDPAYSEFFDYLPNGVVESAAYRSTAGNALCYVARQKHSSGRIVACDVLDADASAQEVRERYRYDKRGRLLDVDVIVLERGQRKERHRFDILYDRQSAEMLAVRKHYDYLRRNTFLPIYWNQQIAPTVQQLTARIRKKLLVQVPKAVRTAEIAEPAYCLALTCHTGEVDDVPPVLAVGLASDLERIRARVKDPKALKAEAWNPKRFSRGKAGAIPLPRDEELAWLCHLFAQRTDSMGDTWSARKLIAGVCQTLNTRGDLAKRLQTTSDFVVYMVDLDDELREMYLLKRDLKESVPAAKLARLRRSGLV
jgi:hypothetical protein